MFAESDVRTARQGRASDVDYHAIVSSGDANAISERFPRHQVVAAREFEIDRLIDRHGEDAVAETFIRYE
jgi:hypothetical protein